MNSGERLSRKMVLSKIVQEKTIETLREVEDKTMSLQKFRDMVVQKVCQLNGILDNITLNNISQRTRVVASVKNFKKINVEVVREFAKAHLCMLKFPKVLPLLDDLFTSSNKGVSEDPGDIEDEISETISIKSKKRSRKELLDEESIQGSDNEYTESSGKPASKRSKKESGEISVEGNKKEPTETSLEIPPGTKKQSGEISVDGTKKETGEASLERTKEIGENPLEIPVAITINMAEDFDRGENIQMSGSVLEKSTPSVSLEVPPSPVSVPVLVPVPDSPAPPTLSPSVSGDIPKFQVASLSDLLNLARQKYPPEDSQIIPLSTQSKKQELLRGNPPTVPQGNPQVPPQGNPQRIPRLVPSRNPQVPPQKIAQGNPQTISQGSPQKIAQGNSPTVLQVTPQGNPQTVMQAVKRGLLTGVDENMKIVNYYLSDNKATFIHHVKFVYSTIARTFVATLTHVSDLQVFINRIHFKREPQNSQIPLYPGDTIMIGNVLYRFECLTNVYS